MSVLVLIVLVAMAVVMTVGWSCQRAANNGGWTDVFWTYGTGATLATSALVPFGGNSAPTWRQTMVAAIVAVWALRLGTYVAARVARGPEDARYAALRRDWGGTFQRNMFGLLIVQAPATALLSISVLLAARNPEPGLRLADLAGAALLVVAILGETVADGQMKRFKAVSRGERVVCDVGLWGWSRHPNYVFEFLGWLAYPVIAVRLSEPLSWLSFVAPAVMFCVLRFGTGVPPLEAAMLRSKGDSYRRYQARVSPFLPLPPRKESA